ncbi:MAG: VacJ family lipoprotein [Gammaproteobacteria bacterium]|nr:MAG: VacJ family lipoprotein [Gammaproteobacteria bacterium]
MNKNNFQSRLSALIFLTALLLLGGCSAIPEKSPDEEPPQRSAEKILNDGEEFVIDVYDPFEGFNRSMYRFNYGFDRHIFLPVVNAYDYITPVPVQKGISNFFDNLLEIRNILNSALQLKPKPTATSTARLVINTTIGILGFSDPASKMGLLRHEEDFGQTLGRYGVGNGPYLVLPILGPSNLRDAGGLLVDTAIMREIDPFDLDGSNSDWEVPYYLLNAIDTRHQVKFRYYDTGSPFEYELLRLLYTKKRKLEIAK